MGLLQELNSGPRYLKAGFLGFNKSGKTYTATVLAAGVRNHFKDDRPIAFFDTEGGTDYLKDTILKLTGRSAIGLKSRSFDDLIAVGREAETAASVLIVDSMTHVWRELCDAYMKKLNDQLERQNKSPKRRMELADTMKVKELWSAWPDFYLNSKLHIIICGRAGYEWNMVENDETGKKELTKTGVKMKVESEFGFEPSLLIEMERVQEEDAKGKTLLKHQATVLGDRFGVIDAKTALNPGFEFFLPHVAKLDGVHKPIDTTVKTDPPIDADGNDEWAREKKARAILCEEIQGELLRAWPGMTADEKKAKADAIERCLGTRSWTKVESMKSSDLRNGLEQLRTMTQPREEASA